METFELWSYDVAGDLGQYAEHTYLHCPEKNSYFNCWGNHLSPTQGAGVERFVTRGLYGVADLYRRDMFGVHDTAGLGVYGVNGVCHQTANLFLYSSGRAITIQDGVKGYAASTFAYGIYGDCGILTTPFQGLFLAFWKATVYTPSYHAYTHGQPPGNLLFQGLKLLHDSIMKQESTIPPHELIHQEASLLAEQAVPGLNPGTFKDLHLDFLKEKVRVLASGLQGSPLAAKINEVSAQFQKALAQRIGGPAYTQLTGLAPGATVNIVDPTIAAAVAAK